MAYDISKDDAPVTIISDDVAYGMDPEDCHINAAPMIGPLFNRDNIEFHKFLKSLIQGTKDWKWIEKSKGGRDAMKALMEH